nr:uncharacterized protein LOC128679482 [Plodia interpunctella]
MGTVIVDMKKVTTLQRTQSWFQNEHCDVIGAHAVILRVSSVFGLAPLRFKSNGNGYVVSLSIPMCIYSYLLVTILVSMAYFGIISEIQLGVSPFLHNSSRLSQIMSFCDVSFLAILGSAGVYGAPARMRSMIKFMDTIATVRRG